MTRIETTRMEAIRAISLQKSKFSNKKDTRKGNSDIFLKLYWGKRWKDLNLLEVTYAQQKYWWPKFLKNDHNIDSMFDYKTSHNDVFFLYKIWFIKVNMKHNSFC